MSMIQLQLPDDLRATAQTRAAQEGFPSLDQYIASLIRADQYNGPADITAASQDHLKRMLHEGLNSGSGQEISEHLWDQKKQSLATKFGAAK